MASIQDIIRQDKGYPAKAAKYHNPLRSYYRDTLPAWILRRFLKQATIEEIATFYFGYYGYHSANFLSFLDYHKNEVPNIHGIKTMEFWNAWQRKNLLAIMDQASIFGR
jgi:hypothetical protein